MSRIARLLKLWPSILVLVVTVACADFTDLAMRQDHRLTFTAPDSRDVVKPPFKLSWTMDDFRVVKPGTGDPERSAGYFAIFIDKAPMKPGQTVEDFVDDDKACQRDPDCPDAQYLADRGVYTTAKTTLKVKEVLPLASNDAGQLHEATIVLLDNAGRRIGESSWYLQFDLAERTS